MSKGVLRVGMAIIFLAAFGLAQAGPRLTAVDPAAGKAGDNLTIMGENLGKDTVESVLLSDDDKDYPADMVEQSADKIVMKVPQVKAGSYNVSIKIGNHIYIQPIRFTVQE
ncbi:MAG: IPT/TIG domain-containing protein [Acidobacteria bacterium]|nr:IPT/TIG domain-containing protein [Acidobacteriota bacterium]